MSYLDYAERCPDCQRSTCPVLSAPRKDWLEEAPPEKRDLNWYEAFMEYDGAVFDCERAQRNGAT